MSAYNFFFLIIYDGFVLLLLVLLCDCYRSTDIILVVIY